MAIHFIADLHLSPANPQVDALFTQTLNAWQNQIDALYILGDLFDAWIGDDDDSPFVQQKLRELSAFAQQTPLYVMPGNRDFLFGETFATASGATLLPDPTPIAAYQNTIVLTHGDSLCTADIAYQQFREQTRNPAWQAAMLAKPLPMRRIIAQQLREKSLENAQKTGLSAISDVTESAVHELFKQQAKAGELPIMIHGHTHRPGKHIHTLEGKTTERWVLPDWTEQQGGGFLRLDENGLTALPLPFV